MISGFNTDVDHQGQVFHVQTEEKGPGNPVVVTLVYCGGQIVGSREAPYAAPDNADGPDEDEIRSRMREQHRVLIREIRTGKFDPPPMPYGHDLVTDRSLDELVLDYLGRSIDEIEARGAEAPSSEDEAAGDERGPSPGRAVHVARVLQRLERFLDAAERAGVDRATVVATEVPTASAAAAPAPTEPPPSICIDLTRSAPAATEEIAPAPRARRGIGKHFAVAAVLAAAAGTTAWMLLGPPPGDTTDGISVAAPMSPPAPAAGVPSETNPEVPRVVPAGPATDPLEQPAETELTPPEAPPVADSPARARVTAPARRAPVPARASAPTPAQQAGRADADVGVPSPAPPDDQPGPVTASIGIPSEPAVQAGQLVDLASVDVTPRPRRRDLPRYTPRARRTEQQGIVELRMLIDERGEVADVELIRDDAGADLAQESMSIVRAWTFSPARKDRQPVKVWQDIAIEFTILENRSTSVRIRE